jgi:hypothetical protein
VRRFRSGPDNPPPAGRGPRAAGALAAGPVGDLITWVTVRPAAYLAMMLAYRRDRIDWGRAGRWVGLRELADDSRISAFGLMYPLLVVTTVVLPPCVLLPARWWRRSVRLLIGVWFAALAFSMWRIAAFC